MTPEQLRASVLQFAIQGKLVEHRVEDGSAKDIVQKITEKKNVLIKKDEAKKSKTLTAISDDEKLFDIPENWQWIKLGEIASLITKGTTPRGGNVAYLDEGIGFLRAENVAGLDVLDKSNLKYIDEETHNGYLKRSIIEANDILITIAGTLGRTGLVREEDLPLNANQAVSMVRLVDISDIDLKYIIYVLNSPEIQKYLTQQKKTTAIPNLTLEIIENCVCPLPPLEEQHRIVAKIEELLPHVDRYAEAYEKLEKFNAKFPEDMKKSIRQYAIQGKLVEQRPEEGTAEELYQQIQDEKQKLIKEGKIKKEKPLAEITEDEIPFEIPESWIWVRLSDVIDVRDGTHDTPGYIPEGYPLITGKDFYNGYFDFAKTKYISKEDYEEIIKRSKVDIDDILFSMIGGNIGSMIVITEENYIDMAIKNVALFKQYNYELSLTGYLEVFLRSQVPNMQAIAKGGAQSFVSLNMLRNYPFPLPPMEEQKRIVSRIKEIIPICERLV